MSVEPSLNFSMTTGAWLLVNGESNWRFQNTGDALRAAAYLPLKAYPGSGGPELETVVGTADFAGGDADGCRLLLVPYRPGSEPEVLAFGTCQPEDGDVEWLDGMFEDGWLACEAALHVEDAGRLGLQFYLPSRAGLVDKHLWISIDGQDAGDYVIARDTLSEVFIEFPESDKTARKVDFKTSYAEPIPPNGDQRPLGVLLVALKIGAANWRKLR